MIKFDSELKASDLGNKIKSFWELSGSKIGLIEREYDTGKGSPVYTVRGKYTTRGWTEWTQGFQYGSAILQFDATGEQSFLKSGRDKTVSLMAPHLSHIGVHDHGFNNVSTYGNLLRLMHEGRIEFNPWEKNFYALALKVSGAVQASRWTEVKDGGFIHSFNGPHSLFVDTIRSCRALILGHALGHSLLAEGDKKISLLGRAIRHLEATAKYAVFYGEGRDIYDINGRVAHESIFNTKDGNFRCPNSQQGYTGFTTWTRGLAWAICGFAEQLEWFSVSGDEELKEFPGKKDLLAVLVKAAKATCDFYIDYSPTDGVPYWDTGAPQLDKIGDYLDKPADPYNGFEPVDSSAAAIAAQGLLRMGRWLQQGNTNGNTKEGAQGSKEGDTHSQQDNIQAGNRYWQAGLTVLNTLLGEPYLSKDPHHQGLLLHSIYHRPNGWDYVPEGSRISYGESSQWGDYHIREAALYAQRIIRNEPYYTFFNIQ